MKNKANANDAAYLQSWIERANRAEQQCDELLAAYKRLTKSTEVNGQRYSIMPSCGAWADIEAAIAKAEGRAQ